MTSASLWGDSGTGAAYELLCDLLMRMRYVSNRWETTKDGDCSFGSTAHMIRTILDQYGDGTVFHKEEVNEWIAQFKRLHKRAKKRLPKKVSLSEYHDSVISDLQVILDNSTDVDDREEWEVERDMHIKEFAERIEWTKEFRKSYRRQRPC